MAAKPLPVLPLELIDEILSLAMPSTLTVHVNCYNIEEQDFFNGIEPIIRVHTTDITSLLTICAFLRLSTYHRKRTIKALNTTTTLLVDMVSNSHATGIMPRSPSSGNTYEVSDAIIGEINHIQFRETNAYTISSAATSHIPRHLLSRRLTVSLSKPQQWARYAIDDFKWEYATHHLCADGRTMLESTRVLHEIRMRHELQQRLLPLDLWQEWGAWLWVAQQIIHFQDLYRIFPWGSIYTCGRKQAMVMDGKVEEEGLVWEREGEE